MDSDHSKPASHIEQVVYVTALDLPLSCPMPHMRLWDSHPRVYLPITNTKQMACPYCNTVYHLIEDDTPNKLSSPE